LIPVDASFNDHDRIIETATRINKFKKNVNVFFILVASMKVADE